SGFTGFGYTTLFRSDWNTAANWDLGRVPTGTDFVRVSGGVVLVPSISNAQVLITGGQVTLTGSLYGSVTVASGGTLVIDGNGDKAEDDHGLNGPTQN